MADETNAGSAPETEADDRAFETIAKRFRALADPSRLKLLFVLRTEEERSVGELAQLIGTSQSNVSRHLSLLHAHGIVARRQQGNSALYRVADPSIFSVCQAICGGIELNLDRQRRGLADVVGGPASDSPAT